MVVNDDEGTYNIGGEIDLSYLVITNPDNIKIPMPVKVWIFKKSCINYLVFGNLLLLPVKSCIRKK